MKRPALWLAILLVLVTDAIVLLGVWRNRSGAPGTMIELTERELPLDSPGEENTGVSLRLSWNGSWSFGMAGNEWFDRAKLAEVGFDTSLAPTDSSAEIRYRHVLPREALVALEYDGEAWQRWLAREKAAANLPSYTPPSTSHLVAVDVGLDAARLRERYRDRKKYLIVRAVVRLVRMQKWDPQERKPAGPFLLQGTVSEILPGAIHVPLPLADVLGKRPKHYTVGLAYGKRFEPWVVSVGVTGE